MEGSEEQAGFLARLCLEIPRLGTIARLLIEAGGTSNTYLCHLWVEDRFSDFLNSQILYSLGLIAPDSSSVSTASASSSILA